MHQGGWYPVFLSAAESIFIKLTLSYVCLPVSQLHLGVWGSRLQITEMHLTKRLGNEEQTLASCEKYGLALVTLPVEALL